MEGWNSLKCFDYLVLVIILYCFKCNLRICNIIYVMVLVYIDFLINIYFDYKN